MTKKLKLLSITTAAAVAVMCAAGVTVAVVTTDNPSSGSLSTANLELSAKAENIKVFTAVPATAGDTDVFEDENGSLYKYEQSVNQGDEASISFSHGGGVAFDEKSVTVEGILPGDKVEFDIAVTSTSSISFNYRAELYVDASEGATLLNQLDFSAGSLGLLRQDITDAETHDGLANAVLTDYTEWSAFGGNQASIERITVSVSLPITADDGQGETVKLYYVVKGESSTELSTDVAEVTDADGNAHYFKYFSDAVDYAERHGLSNISILNSTLLEEGEVNISRALKITGVADENGNYPTLKGARISVKEASAATFENVNFAGNGYINVSDATALTLKNCIVNVNTVKFFDTASRSYLPDPAFIVSGTSLTPVRLSLTDNVFASEKSASICMRSKLRDGSELTDNVFGSSENPYNGGAALALGGAETDANVTLKENTIYGQTPLTLGNGASGRFTVISSNNIVYGNGIFAGGVAEAAFLDSGSVINGNALTLANIACDTLLFGGVDVTLDGIQKISTGKICLSDAIKLGDFYVNYVTGGTLGATAIALYKNGTLYGYLNNSGEVEEI